MNKFIVIVLIIFAFGLTAAFAQEMDEKGFIHGWVDDKELEKDIFIHEKASTLSKMIGEIPFVNEEGAEVIVEIGLHRHIWQIAEIGGASI